MGDVNEWFRRRLLAQHLLDTTPPVKGENPIQAAGVLILVLLALVGLGFLVGKGCW